MNWKIIVIGGVVFYVATWVISLAVTVPLLHEGILVPTYEATSQFWRPELMQEPPDMAALLPRWIITGLIGAFVIAGIYGYVRSTFTGSGWQRGLKYGFVLFLLGGTFMLGMTGVFNLPDRLWAWWGLESLVIYLLSGAALGWVADKVAPRTA